MKRILSTSAMALVIATGPVLAEQHTNGDTNASGDASASQSMDGSIFATVPSDPSMVLGTDYIGQTVYTMMTEQPAAEGEMAAEGDAAATDEAASGEAATGESQDMASGDMAQQPQSVGDISDIIMSEDGQVEYVILGVGGFLGIGERNVAVNFDALNMQSDPQNEGEMMIMIEASQEQIENAPEFDPAVLEGEAAGGMAGQEASGDMSGDEQAAEMDGSAEQSMEEAGDAAENAAENTGEAVENTAENAGEATENAAEDAAQATENAAEDAAQASENAAENAENAAEDAANDAAQATEDAAEAAEEATSTSN